MMPNMMPDLSWLGLQNDTLPDTNKTEMQFPQQASVNTLPKEPQNDIKLNTRAIQNSESNEKMDRHLQEWQNMKPDIARLVALEGKVKELMKQLKSMNANPSTNAHIADKNTQVMQKSTSTHNAAAEQQTPFVNSKNMYAIQLFSLTDKNIMRRTWKSVSTKHPIILGNLLPIYEEVSMQGKTFYRVKAGSFETKSAAMKLCGSLKNANTNCFLAKSTGIAML
ncbi:MAG: hypothetical protein ACJAXM_000273 [Arenicella sp.]|jgi:hypothetical protein